MNLEDMKSIVTMAGVGVGAISLGITAWSTWKTFQTNRARFWLDLRSQFAKHDEVHRNLRPGGKWSSVPVGASKVDGPGPETVEEWADVESYMGLFEHCEIMLDQKLLDSRTFEEIYRYRILNVTANKRIRVEKLISKADGWRRFLDLMERTGVHLKKS
jgi:hypothetical protein